MKKNKGFTLVELVIVITIIGITASILGFMLIGTIKAWTFKFNRNDILWDGRLALDRMTREIRTIKDIESVTIATSSQFKFIDAGNKVIIYSLNIPNLNRTENEVTNLLAENMSSLAFTYYDENEVVTDVFADIRRVRISLTLTKNGENVYLRSDASTKNF